MHGHVHRHCEEGGEIVTQWGQWMLSAAVRGGNRWHDEGKDDAQTNVGSGPNGSGGPNGNGGGSSNDGDCALFHCRKHRNDNGRTR